jgi:hypothetical protein
MADESNIAENESHRDGIQKLLKNPVGLIGAALALVSLANIGFLFLIDVFAKQPSPYVGILGYMIVPAFFVLGVLLIPFGALLERRQLRKLKPEEVAAYPRIDLNKASQRGAVAFFLSFVVVFVVLSALGSYRAYEFTDSVQFCGQLCHSVMNPEFTAYQGSPHARVRCVDCHVGPGATWYVRSKLSGARQVYATVFHTFPKPIPSPVENLRPAQETCEQCHWPKKFHGAQLKVFTHYASDEVNTPRQVRLLIRTGGGDGTNGPTMGIHWHMNIENEISYIAADEKRQVIPYIRVKDQQGRVTEYRTADSKLTPEQIAATPKRKMDCVDCHNRPTHIYIPPDRAVDQSLTAHRMDITLPYLKQQAVAVLTATYATTEAAMQGIATGMHNFYSSKYPELEKAKREQIQTAITEVQRIYRVTTFPEMKLDWKTHPDNVGHFYSPGCFRCHDGQHVSADGKIVPKGCDTCHEVLGQENGATIASTRGSTPFQHPVDLGDLTAVSCNDCHTGGVSP